MEIQIKLVCVQTDGDDMRTSEYDLMKVGNGDQLIDLVGELLKCSRDWLFKEEVLMNVRAANLREEVKRGFRRLEDGS